MIFNKTKQEIFFYVVFSCQNHVAFELILYSCLVANDYCVVSEKSRDESEQKGEMVAITERNLRAVGS